jgi:hypothetical protein
LACISSGSTSGEEINEAHRNGSSAVFNGSSVKVVEDFGSGTPSNETGAEAARICGKVGKKSEFASYRSLPNYQTEYRYLCL